MTLRTFVIGLGLSACLGLSLGCGGSGTSDPLVGGTSLYGVAGANGFASGGGPNGTNGPGSGDVGPGTGPPQGFSPGAGGPTPDPTPDPPTILPFESFLYLPALTDAAVVTLGQAADGLLTLLVAGTPTAEQLESLTRSPDGNFLYALSQQSITTFAFRDGDGVLTQVGSPLPTSDFSVNLVLTPGTPGYAYVSNPLGGGDVITGYRRENDGSLTPLPGFPLPVDAGGFDRFRLSMGTLADKLYAVISDGGDVQRYQIEADGSLTELDLVSGAASRMWKIAFSKSTPYAYATNVEASSISIFGVDSVGALTLLGSFNLPSTLVTAGTIRPFDIVSHPTLPVMYCQATTGASMANGAVAVLGIDPLTGNLTLLDQENPGVGIGSIFFDFTGTYLFTTAGLDVIFSYIMNPVDGTLDPLESFVIDPSAGSTIFGDPREGASVENTLFKVWNDFSR